MPLLFLCLILLSLPLLAVTGNHPNIKRSVTHSLEVVYPRTMRGLDESTLYPLVLLKAALTHSGAPYTIKASTVDTVQSRALKELLHKGGINVAWSMTTQQRENDLLPVRIPLFKGLYGWRLLFTKQSYMEKLTSINKLTELQKLYFIQGHDWPDTQILINNDFMVTTSVEYDSLFNMLNVGRGDVFPRSILEVEGELEAFKDKVDLTIVPHLMLQYPTAVYFFFDPNNPEIANAVRRGLQLMQENGEFDKLFLAFYGTAIQRANIPSKTIIKLQNSFLPKQTPLADDSLWFSVHDLN
ncbi:hypothetical protein [Pseudoalteromonas mariniglutinosa]|uniref:hypothetical protein n=1 Tax=Pseudoalteromonas mariniglutinosa TaxID=206042 RepID=UPI00384A7168